MSAPAPETLKVPLSQVALPALEPEPTHVLTHGAGTGPGVAAFAVMVTVAWPEAPNGSVTFSMTAYAPAFANVWTPGFWAVEVVPSRKSHRYASACPSGSLERLPPKVTVRGANPLVGDASMTATGAELL